MLDGSPRPCARASTRSTTRAACAHTVEKCQFRTEKCQIRTEKCSWGVAIRKARHVDTVCVLTERGA